VKALAEAEPYVEACHATCKKATLAAHSRTHRGDRTENLLCVHWNEINCDLMPLEWLPHDWLESLEGGQIFKLAFVSSIPVLLDRDNRCSGWLGNSLIAWINRHFERILF